MDLRKIKKLIELVEESGISELEVKSGDEAVRIARPSGVAVPVGLRTSATLGQPDASPVATADTNDNRGNAVKSPMAGTFYAAPAPDATAYVQVGDQVSPGQVLCIIESMKMMNEIKAPVGGVCSDSLVSNGSPVTTNQTLFHIT